MLFKLFIAVIVTAFFALPAALDIRGQNKEGLWNLRALDIPKVQIPPEAAATGLGGPVNVRVRVDETGKVIKIEDIVGPGWVCPSISRSDVLALRSAAVAAAQNTVFSPATEKGHPVKSSTWIAFIFPEKKDSDPWRDYESGKTSSPFSASQNEKPAGPKVIDGGVVNGKAIKLPVPQYPLAAHDAGVTGKVDIKVFIQEDGIVFAAETVSGHPLLRTAARLAACKAKFSRTQLSGKSVAVFGIITYNFRR